MVRLFENIIANPWYVLLAQAAFIFLTALIVAQGFKRVGTCI